jgi:hypothetical protein
MTPPCQSYLGVWWRKAKPAIYEGVFNQAVMAWQLNKKAPDE